MHYRTMNELDLLFLVFQYGILLQTAQFLSTLDLLNLALTCKELHCQVLGSEAVFKCLKRVALCDGRGLELRQEFKGLYELKDRDFVWGSGRKVYVGLRDVDLDSI